MLKYGATAWDLGHSNGLRVQAWANLALGEVDRGDRVGRAVRRAARQCFQIPDDIPKTVN